MPRGSPLVMRVARSIAQVLGVVSLLAFSVPLQAQTTTASSPTPEAPRPLRFEGLDGLAPFQYLDENGEPQGFNVDLVRAISRVRPAAH